MRRSRSSSVRGVGPLLLLPVQAALMVGLGRLVTGPAAGHWPLSAEASIGRDLVEGRDPATSGVTELFSVLAGTQAVIGVTLVSIVALLVLPRAALRTEALFLGVSVAAQSAVFVSVTAFVDRPRPAVPHEDAAPPTSSFPSGHVGASLALYGGLAVIAALRMRGPWRHAVTGILLLIPPAVGLSRMYRGMHYPSDVAGGLLNGTLTLLITGFALLYGRHPAAGTDGAERSDREVPAPRGTGGPVLAVRHPYGCPDELADRLAAVLREHGHRDLRWILTSAELPCGTLAEELRTIRPALVVVCAGDGTLRACAEILAGTRIPLAVAPCGTGNLLARNLGLPMDPAAALAESLSGESFGIDVGRVRGDGLEPTRFTVMAGAGFDAAMVRDASPRLKSRMGWAAYVLSALRHLRDPGVRLTVRVDGAAGCGAGPAWSSSGTSAPCRADCRSCRRRGRTADAWKWCSSTRAAPPDGSPPPGTSRPACCADIRRQPPARPPPTGAARPGERWSTSVPHGSTSAAPYRSRASSTVMP